MHPENLCTLLTANLLRSAKGLEGFKNVVQPLLFYQTWFTKLRQHALQALETEEKNFEL